MPVQKFNVTDFTNVCQFIENRSFEEFFEMYKSLGFVAESYAQEKFSNARSNFSYWWCNLDPCTQENVVIYIHNFYDK